MQRQAEHVVYLVDTQGQQVGQIAIERREEKLNQTTGDSYTASGWRCDPVP
jgi:hypothetical protein